MEDNKKIILENIKNNKNIFSTERQLHLLKLADLLEKDEENITYLEYACKNRVTFPENIQQEIINNNEAIHICLKNKYIYWINNEDMLFKNIEGNKLLIDLIYETGNNILINLKIIKNHPEIVDYLIKYNDIYSVVNLSSNILEGLFTEHNGTYQIDKYSDKPTLINLILKSVSLINVLNYCNKTDNYEILKYAGEEYLLTNIDENKTIIEELLDRNIDPLFYGYDFKDPEIINILIKRNRLDLLYNADITLLLSNYSNDKTYFDLMIDEHNKGKDMSFEKLSQTYYLYPSEITANKLLTMAKNNIINYFPRITKDVLLYREKNDKLSVIEWLIQKDKDLTVSTILPECRNLDDPELAITLKILNVENTPINIEIPDRQFTDDYIDEYNRDYTKDCTSEYEYLLTELRDLFYQDGKSDKSLVDALITSYRYPTSIGNSYVIAEINMLIKIKQENYDKFIYTKDTQSYFSANKGSVHLSSAMISTINHETSHALHYYMTNFAIPSNFQAVIERIRNDPNVIKRVSMYSKDFHAKKQELRENIPKDKISEYYDTKYKGKKLDELKETLASSKEKLKKKLKERYPEDTLDTILEKNYTPDAFIEERKKIEEAELVDAIFRCKYETISAVSDILDAIFEGKFYNSIMKQKDGTYIKGSYGHGLKYYSDEEKIFSEMVANYGAIIKSKHGKEIIAYLRKFVGNELIDMLDKFYTEDILKVNFDKEESHAR